MSEPRGEVGRTPPRPSGIPATESRKKKLKLSESGKICDVYKIFFFNIFFTCSKVLIFFKTTRYHEITNKTIFLLNGTDLLEFVF